MVTDGHNKDRFGYSPPFPTLANTTSPEPHVLPSKETIGTTAHHTTTNTTYPSTVTKTTTTIFNKTAPNRHIHRHYHQQKSITTISNKTIASKPPPLHHYHGLYLQITTTTSSLLHIDNVQKSRRRHLYPCRGHQIHHHPRHQYHHIHEDEASTKKRIIAICVYRRWSRGVDTEIAFAEAPKNIVALPDVCHTAGVAFDGAAATSCITATASATGSIVEIAACFSSMSHRFRQR